MTITSEVVSEVEYHNPNRGVHRCESLLVRCMDFRFLEKLEEMLDKLFAKEGGFGKHDSPGPCGGGSLSIIDREARKQTFKAIDIACKKHEIKRIIIVDHIDCSAWGGSVRFHNHLETERAFHIDKLRESARILESEYPNLTVHLVYQDWDKIQRISA